MALEPIRRAGTVRPRSGHGTRARRSSGGFAYTNAIVAERAGEVAGMVLSYPIEAAPEGDPDDLPAPIAPFVELETRSVGTWFVNALAVAADARGQGVGSGLLSEVEAIARRAGYATISIQVYAQNGTVTLPSLRSRRSVPE